MPSVSAVDSVSNVRGGSSSVRSSNSKSRALIRRRHGASRLEQRKAQRLAAGAIRLGDAARQGAHPQNEALPLGDGHGMPRIQQIECVRGLDHLFVGRQYQLVLEQALAGGLMRIELHRQDRGVGLLEIVGGLLHFVLVKHVAVGDGAERAFGPHDVENAFLALDVHRPGARGHR